MKYMNYTFTLTETEKLAMEYEDKDNLLDLIEYTYGLGIIDLVKIVGTAEETEIGAIAEDKSVVVSGKTKTPVAEFIGTFGMPNLGKLKTILSFDDYDASATIDMTRKDVDGEDIPTAVHFATKAGDFVNDYSLMSKAFIEEKVRNVTFKGAAWDIEFEPTIAGILRLKKQAQANSEELNFTTKTDNGDLKIFFGDPSTHSGNFVFQPGVTGTLSRTWQWPVKVFLSIMDLPGDKTVRISDQGAAQITVDSGYTVSEYLLPAQAKQLMKPYDLLYAVGDSYTLGIGQSDDLKGEVTVHNRFSQLVADHYKLEHVNHAIAGSSNELLQEHFRMI